jgi:hypothetical protein
MTQELRQIGFKLTSGEVERKLVSILYSLLAGADRPLVPSLYLPSPRERPARLPHRRTEQLVSLVALVRSSAHSFLRSETLVAGNVITIEPGCYVPSDPSYPKHFHGLGIRIEVSLRAVSVRRMLSACVRTTSRLPRTDRSICRRMRRKRWWTSRPCARGCWSRRCGARGDRVDRCFHGFGERAIVSIGHRTLDIASHGLRICLCIMRWIRDRQNAYSRRSEKGVARSR